MVGHEAGLDGEAIERVGHHVSNALTVITGHAELLINRDSESHVRSHAVEILQAVRRVEQLLAELKEICLPGREG